MMKVPKNLTDKRFINAIFSEEKGENFNFEVNDFGNIIKVPSKEEDAPTCRINLCEPPTHDNEIPQITDGVKKFIVEFGSEKTSINVYKDKKIKLNDIIGYIDNIPVKSKLNGKILEVYQKYIVGEYDTDIDEMLGDLGLSRDMKQEDLQAKFKNDGDVQSIIDSMEKYQQSVSFIKDYILKFRFADLTSHVSTSSNKKTSKLIENLNSTSTEIIESYENEIEEACDKDKIKAQCENNKLLDVKSEIDEINKRNLNKIINEWQQVKQGKYGQIKGRISDYCLVNSYVDYLTKVSDDDNKAPVFVYDEKNPFVVELYYNICNFIRQRNLLERNPYTVSKLLDEFKELCDETIKQYWIQQNGLVDYYTKIKSTFKYDFYQANTEDYISASINDKDRVTLYEKVLNYLKSLTKYQEPKSAQEKYSDPNANVDNIINMSDEEKAADDKSSILLNKFSKDESVDEQNENLLKALKKIAISFVLLRKLETDANNSDYYSDYIDTYTLNKAKNMDTDYYDGMSYEGSSESKQILKKYLGALKDVTDNEAKILDELTKKAVNWYLQNGDKVTSGELFDILKEINWPSKSIIKRNDEPYDFFYLENKNDLQNEQAENDEEFTEDSAKTRYGVDSYMYWLKYCTSATIANCMMPMYWGTGVVISGAPVLLPIIFIPIYPMPGRVTVLFGIGLCGMCPLPMIYFVNMSDTPGFMIPLINILVDMLKQIPPKIMNMSNDIIKESLNATIKGNNEKIDTLKDSINEIDKEIKELGDGINDDIEALKEMKKARKDDTTSHESKNQNQKKRKREKSKKQ